MKTKFKLAEIENDVLRLRRAGKRLAEIASELGVARGRVAKVSAQMYREGRLTHGLFRTLPDDEPPPDGCGAGTAAAESRHRENIIAAMTEQGATLAAIGQRLGVTPERARQLRQDIENKQGRRRRGKVVTSLAAAAALGMTPTSFLRWCRKAGVQPLAPRSVPRLLYAADVERVQRLIAQWHSKACAECGRTFQPSRAGQCTCSLACRRRRLAAMRFAVPSPTAQWQGHWSALWHKLRRRAKPSIERWLSPAEAVRVSGLRYLQLTRLRLRKIIRARPTNRAYGRGTGWLLAESDVRLAGKVWQEELLHLGNDGVHGK